MSADRPINNPVAAFFRLVRWPNLVFIALTQFLFQYCAVAPLFNDAHRALPLDLTGLLALSISSVLIAAGGYVINDYFDYNIDLINKPDKLVIGRWVSKRIAIFWHLTFSITGVVLGFWLGARLHLVFLGPANAACALLLFLYSISLKKKLISGNVLISALTAWVVTVITLCQPPVLLDHPQRERLARITILYTAFAFIISLIREVIKDIEDTEGDRAFGCRTMPIAWGIPAARLFAAVWITVLAAALAAVQVYVLLFGWWESALYCVAFVLAPFIYILKLLKRAGSPADYHRLSSLVKGVMFTGILSMLFFRIYAH